MAESFAELFEKSLEKTRIQPGEIISGKVVAVRENYVIVNAGLKSEALISIDQFYDKNGNVEVKEGDMVDVALESLEDGYGETILSRREAKRVAAWRKLEEAHKSSETVLGKVTGRVKGGFTVEIGAIKGFLPGSLIDVKPVRDPSFLEGSEIEIKIIKMDQKRNNVVVSRRAVLEAENKVERAALLDKLEEGQKVKGIVKNLTDYGAFIDLGGVDGLLHITDISWKRIKHPSDVLAVGDEISVKILKFDRERNRVSLGLKQLADDPWADIARRYPVNTRLFGRVSNVTDYGCFVEIEPGVEGLVHVSEMDWTNKNINPSKIVQVGDEVEVMVLEIDEDRRRISLGIKQCQENPWKSFADKHNKGEKISGKIKSMTDFGIFVGLDGGIDGLVHLSDISWETAGEEAIREYTKGQEIEAVILAIDAERERISLGIKQLIQDGFTDYLDKNPKGTVVTGSISEVDSKRALVDLGGGIVGQIRAADMARKSEEANLKAGEEVEACVTGVDAKSRMILLSIKALDNPKESGRNEVASEPPPSAKLGDLLKEQLENKEKEAG